MKVIFSSKVLVYIENLVPVLYELGYFRYSETAKKYVDELYDDIITNIHTRQKKLAPTYFDKYGKNMYYAIFKKNRRTSWYVFFKTSRKDGEVIYKILYIANNHTVAHHI